MKTKISFILLIIGLIGFNVYFGISDQNTTSEIGLLSLQKAFANNEDPNAPCVEENTVNYLEIHDCPSGTGTHVVDVTNSTCDPGTQLTWCREFFIYSAKDCDTGLEYEEWYWGEITSC